MTSNISNTQHQRIPKFLLFPLVGMLSQIVGWLILHLCYSMTFSATPLLPQRYDLRMTGTITFFFGTIGLLIASYGAFLVLRQVRWPLALLLLGGLSAPSIFNALLFLYVLLIEYI